MDGTEGLESSDDMATGLSVDKRFMTGVRGPRVGDSGTFAGRVPRAAKEHEEA